MQSEITLSPFNSWNTRKPTTLHTDMYLTCTLHVPYMYLTCTLHPSVIKEVKLTLEQITKTNDGWVVNATPRPLYPQEGHGTHSIGAWVGPRAFLEGC